ncbi:hypothetical protein NQ318_006407 [Aromia moschata]|uniref:acid phosphatase n=1 Tax=Aromia moschata TaxID=1265417 RepID=A0AAV8YHP0_9CUCU|nr:hypothetical protein NQ318_006407 [Aromia moschata]
MVMGDVLILLTLFYILSQIRSESTDDTLVLVHTIFRHGDRNPDLLNLFPKSPYYNESFYAPFGYGQLTNKGKVRAYKVGTDLRERYNGFLDETYNIDLIEPRSSDFNRTKGSLEVMLAGLFPPTPDLVWMDGFNWQPIAFNYVERKYDKELFCYGCPNWDKEINSYLTSEEGHVFTNKYQDTFKYIAKNTGEDITEILQVYYMYFGFTIQEELHLTLPDWTKEVYPEPMKTIAIEYYNLMFSTPNLMKMSGGYLLKKIFSDTRSKINGALPRRKMYIYCGHENNIASVLKILKCREDDEIPGYGAYVLLELHYINDTYGFKLFYQNYNTTEPILLRLPDCDEFCPFEKFISVAEEFIPKDESICGTGSSSSAENFASVSHFIYVLVLILNLF